MLSINPKLAGLSPEKFEKWFKTAGHSGEWKAEYKKIGGKIERKRSIQKSKEDK